VGIRLITSRGNDWSNRYPLVVEAVNHLKVVCCDEKGVAAFHLLRHRRNEPKAFLYAFGSSGAERHGPSPRADRRAQSDAGPISDQACPEFASITAPGARP